MTQKKIDRYNIYACLMKGEMNNIHLTGLRNLYIKNKLR